jgi:hypothetical protein
MAAGAAGWLDGLPAIVAALERDRAITAGEDRNALLPERLGEPLAAAGALAG